MSDLLSATVNFPLKALGLNNLVKSQLGGHITRLKKHFKTSNIALLIKIRFEFIRFFKLKFTVFELWRQTGSMLSRNALWD